MIFTPAFITLHWYDVIDIFLVALLLYGLYNLVRKTAAIKIIAGIVLMLAFWKLVEVMQMRLTANILGQFIGIGAIAVLIIFQPELRRLLLRVGTDNVIARLLKGNGVSFAPGAGKNNKTTIDEISAAVYNLAQTKTGALIVIRQKNELTDYVETGRKIQARLSAELLESLFFKNSPLHDGAVIIDGNNILSASCVLPVTERTDLPVAFGLRHRAAMGLAEITDAVVVVVSEERGSIYVFEGLNYESAKKRELGVLLKTKLKQ